MGLFSVGPLGLEPRTCGLRVRRGAAGQRPRMPFEPRVCNSVIPVVPILSRSFTGMVRTVRRPVACSGPTLAAALSTEGPSTHPELSSTREGKPLR
jgi:hypothetical protein